MICQIFLNLLIFISLLFFVKLQWKESGNLLEVGSLVSAIDESDLIKIPLKLSEPWALENLHVLSTHITDPETVIEIVVIIF